MTVQALSLDSEDTMTDKVLLLYLKILYNNCTNCSMTDVWALHIIHTRIYFYYSFHQHHAVRLQALEQKSLCAAEFIRCHTGENNFSGIFYN